MFTKGEILKALRAMRSDEEMFMVNAKRDVEWLTDWCNIIVVERT